MNYWASQRPVGFKSVVRNHAKSKKVVPSCAEWHGAPFLCFSCLSGHDSKLCVVLQLKSAWEPPPALPTPYFPTPPPSPLHPISSSSSFPSCFFLFFALLSLLHPRMALHDGEAKNSTRNPRISSDGELGGLRRTSAHTRSWDPPTPPLQMFFFF